MESIPRVVPALPTVNPYDRNLAPGSAFAWLRAGWRDLATDPTPSLLRGGFVFLLSIAIVGGLIALNLDFILFPALAGFLIFAPTLAIGLYEKSRALARAEPVDH